MPTCRRVHIGLHSYIHSYIHRGLLIHTRMHACYTHYTCLHRCMHRPTYNFSIGPTSFCLICDAFSLAGLLLSLRIDALPPVSGM